ncbi:hypothetical protein HYFRA_00013801 [Hymenoscyphus fraxineus]|uniref:Uncharacterized protein n=1 Tax=Hymenoscyphus fraxineus TaxID=746836 RepID=A0A9N9PZE2_9HELO|nr:hypothetical protein HYFRA_00013801 [Hymenoscyphus fraxineus]
MSEPEHYEALTVNATSKVTTLFNISITSSAPFAFCEPKQIIPKSLSANSILTSLLFLVMKLPHLLQSYRLHLNVPQLLPPLVPFQLHVPVVSSSQITTQQAQREPVPSVPQHLLRSLTLSYCQPPAPIPIVFELLLLAPTSSEIVVGTGVDVLEAVEDAPIANVLVLVSSLLTEVVSTLDEVRGVIVLCTTEVHVLVNGISGARPTVVKTSKVPTMGQIHTRTNLPYVRAYQEDQTNYRFQNSSLLANPY